MSQESLMALDRLMGLGPKDEPSASAAIDAILQPEKRTRAQQQHDERLEESKRGLKTENSALQAELSELKTKHVRSQHAIKVLAGLSTLALLACAGMFFYEQSDSTRALDQAFKIIHYRENKALGANAIVLDEWSKQLEALKEKIKAVEGISEEERGMRLKTCDAAMHKADALKDGFLNQIKENDRERGVGASFSYKDPFLKKEIKLSEENGGEIDLDKVKAEVKENAKLDSTMKELEKAMLSPVSLAAQIKAAAEDQAQRTGKDTSQAQPQGGLQVPIPGQAGPEGQ